MRSRELKLEGKKFLMVGLDWLQHKVVNSPSGEAVDGPLSAILSRAGYSSF